MSSFEALDGRCFSTPSTSMSSTTSMKRGFQVLLVSISSFSCTSFSVNVSSNSSVTETKQSFSHRQPSQQKSVCKAKCKRMRQPPTLLGQQCWDLLRPCWQWWANGFNNCQQCWDLQCIVGRIQPMRPCKLCLIGVQGLKNVGKAVQTDPTLLRYASAITEQKKM